MRRRIIRKLIFLGIIIIALYKNQKVFAEEQSIIGVSYERPNGENGYYKKAPYFQVENQSGSFEIQYEFWDSFGGEIKGIMHPGENKNFESYFREGKNRLQIWNQTVDGGRRMEEVYEVFLDTLPVGVQMEIVNQKNGWCKDEAIISIRLEEGEGQQTNSGVKQVNYYVNGEQISLNQEQMLYLKENATILVRTEDFAGNQAEYKKSIYVDHNPPQVSISFEETGKIVSKDVGVDFYINEEEEIEAAESKAVLISPEGNEKEIIFCDWKVNGKETTQRVNLTEEGKYRIYLKATDKAGYVTEEEQEIIIDKTCPQIFLTKEIDGKRVMEFKIPKDDKEFYEDFTSCRWQVWMDDRICQKGKILKKEGAHHLKIRIEDSAGNVAEDLANFTIDRTAPNILISGIKNHEIRLGKVNLHIETENSKDMLTKILINGKDELKKERNLFEKQIKTPGFYEIDIEAIDEAGNKEERTLKFQIEENHSEDMDDIDSEKGRKQYKIVIFFVLILLLISIYMHNNQKKSKKYI